MSSDRERIIEFEASTSIPADGWFAIDSTTEGTRKVQKSAIIGSGSLDTTSQEVVGAINEVNQRAATIDSMTQDEYDDLPSTKESDNVPRFITDGVPTFDETLWNKVGTDPLDTTAQDCSGAINEIKQSLSLIKIAENIALSTTIDTKTITSINGAFEVWLLGKVNSTFRGSLAIPYSVFKAGYACYIPCIGGNVSATIYVEYISDTQIKCSTSNATFNYFDIYIKK